MAILNQNEAFYSGIAPTQRQQLEQYLVQPNELDWERVRRLVVSPAPILTLEMALKRVAAESCHGVPEPELVLAALRYAWAKHGQYLSRNGGDQLEAL